MDNNRVNAPEVVNPVDISIHVYFWGWFIHFCVLDCL